ncbi:hypothetical protein ISG33_11165 [Glaciecola sp. MH2013]|uniref:hypothetical protein n=1 Tax=Glaciecola sp. MH2013 TaxID=2785524 RepID=UPI00189CE869|nr:hypothetical protein [Glaciecola sp. MH2013]MBF7073959.1 hypothetical protein [Glaciecola sp. MH2013]
MTRTLFDVLTDQALSSASKAVKGTKAHAVFEKKIRNFAKGFNKHWAKHNVRIQAEVFFTENGESKRRAKGSLGIDVVVFHQNKPLFALDLKTGKAWSKVT